MLHDKMDILDRLTRYCGLLVKMIKRRPKFYPQLVDAQDLKTWFEIQFLLNHIDHCIMMMQFYFQSHTKGSSDIEFERHVFLLSTFSFFTISLSNHHFREFCQLVKVWKFFFWRINLRTKVQRLFNCVFDFLFYFIVFASLHHFFYFSSKALGKFLIFLIWKFMFEFVILNT